jgi:hypothetical protein
MTIAPGAILRKSEFSFVETPGVRVATPVSPAQGSVAITLQYLELSPGVRFSPADTALEENVLVTFAGSGHVILADIDEGDDREITAASALISPTGQSLELLAGPTGLSVYLWRAELELGRRHGGMSTIQSTLWDDTTQLVGFAGTGEIPAAARPATMNFIFWPGTGSPQMCLHCGIQQPGETFNVHLHEKSDEAFIAFEGVGEMFLDDRWIAVSPGDVLYAAPGILHGTRNPDESPTARRFVTCGGPMPYDPFLYHAAGLSSEVES